MRRLLPAFSVNRPVTVVMLFCALVVCGLIAWQRVPLQMMPSGFDLARLWIWVEYPNAAPSETETQVVKVMEEHVATVPGIKEMRSEAENDGGWMSLAFHRSVDMDDTYNAVVDRMDRAMADLPDDVERYWVYRWNPDDEPIMWTGLELPDDADDAYYLMEDIIVPRLERVEGVGKVDFWGVNRKLVYIDFSLDAMIASRVDLYTVMQKLGADNFGMASGRIVDGGTVRYVRSLARYQDIDELRAFPLNSEGLVLSDVAEVDYGYALNPDIGHINGREGAALGINKESGANTVATGRLVEEAMRELEKDPRLEGVEFFTFFNQGELIQDSVDNLLETALYGGLFAVLVLFVFLRDWRMTLLIGACIPFTLLLTVTALYFTGGSLNLLSLMGLMLAVGMVVDNAIVVAESIYARRQGGAARKLAAIEGTSEVNLAITLSTMTTMVVFLPVILMSEDATFSFFMGSLGMPVVWALAASLVTALVFTPLTTTLMRGGAVVAESRWITAMKARYMRTLRWVLDNRTDAFVFVLAMTFVTFVVPVKAVDCEDDSDGNVGEFAVRYEVPTSFSYSERLDVVNAVEGWVDENKDRWGVRVHRSRLGGDSRHGRTYVYLNEEAGPEVLEREAVIEEAKAGMPDIPGVRFRVGWGSTSGQDVPRVNVTLRGEDTSELKRISVEVIRRLEAIPGVLSASAELEEDGRDEIRLRVDRDAAARYGIPAERIGRTVSFAMRGTGLAPLRAGDKDIRMQAGYRLDDLSSMDKLMDFPIWSPVTGSSVPLRAVADQSVEPGLGEIRRENRATAFPIQVDLSRDADKDLVRGMVGGVLSNLRLPEGYSWDWGSERRDEMENDEARSMALLLSVVFVFLLMGVLFESFILPLSVITTIPMAFLGVYWMLYLTGTPLDVMGGVGLVILVGVVVNNGIVLVDLVTQLRHEGLGRTDALVEAGSRRLRPILMTALTTIFGLLPMALGSSTFIGIPYAPLGRVVAGGLIAATVLTLFFVPFLYSVLDDVRQSGGRWLAWVVGRRQPRAAK